MARSTEKVLYTEIWFIDHSTRTLTGNLSPYPSISGRIQVPRKTTFSKKNAQCMRSLTCEAPEETNFQVTFVPDPQSWTTGLHHPNTISCQVIQKNDMMASHSQMSCCSQKTSMYDLTGVLEGAQMASMLLCCRKLLMFDDF